MQPPKHNNTPSPTPASAHETLPGSYDGLWRPSKQRQKGGRLPRCGRCYLELRLCMCTHLPTIHTATKVIVAMHVRESQRTTNTGRLAASILTNCEVRLRAKSHEPFNGAGLERHPDRPPAYVLFPHENAIPLEEAAQKHPGSPLTLVVPDGSWRQARHMLSREKSLAALPRITLPPGPPSVYQRLRKAQQPHQLCTFEAIARCMGILEGQEVEASLMKALEMMIERTLETQGKIPRGTFAL